MQANAIVSSRPGAIRAEHLAACRSRCAARQERNALYVNGIWWREARRRSQFDDPKADLQIGNFSGWQPFQGELADVRLYRRPLDEAEIQALVQPGKQLIQPPDGKAAGQTTARSRN